LKKENVEHFNFNELKLSYSYLKLVCKNFDLHTENVNWQWSVHDMCKKNWYVFM